jgi:fatty-acyl-CoA synthase
MLGLMQDTPLLISSIITHAQKYHKDSEIVTQSVEGGIGRTTYGKIGQRSAQLAHALTASDIGTSDVVASLAWNTDRHLELYFGVSSMGAVLNTVNPRLFPEQLIYVLNHSEAQLMFVDLTFMPLIEKLAAHLPLIKNYIVLTDKTHMPESSLDNLICYEDYIAGQEIKYDWPKLDENHAASLCYTSGTTGNPKGVLYSHRSTVLHAYSLAMKDNLNIGNRDSLMPIVPMFHVNAWGTPYACAMVGCKMVMPGAMMTGENFYNLIRDEGVTIALGVPTIWLGLLQHISTVKGQDFKKLPIETFVIGGSAAPRTMIKDLEETFDATALHAWGMTETSPLGASCRLMAKHDGLSEDEKMDVKCRQGRPPFGLEMKITDDDGTEFARDGKAFGRLSVRGPWVSSAYYKSDKDILDTDGFFDTGDVSTLDPDGYMTIVDRSKDVIKSGGEWISSIELENVAVGHPEIMEAGVIGIAHPKWQERPLLVCVAAEGTSPTKESILEFMEGKIAKWWTPDDVVFLDKMPHTATGKILKTALREIYKDYSFPA